MEYFHMLQPGRGYQHPVKAVEVFEALPDFDDNSKAVDTFIVWPVRLEIYQADRGQKIQIIHERCLKHMTHEEPSIPRSRIATHALHIMNICIYS